MDTSLDRLIERISGLRDDELCAIVHSDSAHYRQEAIVYAKAEISARGISGDPTDAIRPSSRSAPFARFCNRLVKTIWRKAFHLGFLISLLLFMWANHSSFVHRHTSLCDDCFASWGFPFNTYQTGGLAGLTVVLWPGFIANLAIAACTGVCIGWIFNVVLRQTSPRSYSPFKSQI